jgi:hypothetical protein
MSVLSSLLSSRPASPPSSTPLPLRHRVLVGAAFVTAVGTGYVANLDGESLADIDERVPMAAARLASAVKDASHAGRASPLARGDWPMPAADALQAWGQGLSVGVERIGPAGRVGVRTAAAKAAAHASTAGSPTGAAATLPVPPAWRFIGRIDGEGPPRAMLATAQQLHVVAERDTLEGRWRVERIEAHAVRLRALATDDTATLPWEAP